MSYFLSDYIFAAKYPFSSKAKKIIEQRTIEINELVGESGLERIKSVLTGKLKQKVFLHEEDAIKELIEYAVCRMILSYMNNRFLTNKHAIAESKKAYAYFQNENNESLLELAKDLGINTLVNTGDKITIGLADFLVFAPHDIPYKLIFREITNGRVVINKHEEIRLMAEAVKKYNEKTVDIKNVPNIIKKIEKEIYELLLKIEPQKISFKEGEAPPCMEAILELLKKHENVGHNGRWILAVYLINRGLDNQKILEIFSNAPDYNEKIVSYQLEHIRKRGYKMPNCSSILNYGYCIKNCGITNPLIF